MKGVAMSHSYVFCPIHCTFSTKDRRNWIDEDMQQRLWPYLAGIAKENEIKALAVGGIENHVHILLLLPGTMPVAKAVQLVKGGSSKWIHESFQGTADFAWQEGYAAFAVSPSQVDKTAHYIGNQPEHHRTRTFEEEFKDILKKCGIEYDERYVFG
jgi:REP element-mobilizing transposase RayT